jgi:hypothetical protein
VTKHKHVFSGLLLHPTHDQEFHVLTSPRRFYHILLAFITDFAQRGNKLQLSSYICEVLCRARRGANDFTRSS